MSTYAAPVCGVAAGSIRGSLIGGAMPDASRTSSPRFARKALGEVHVVMSVERQAVLQTFGSAPAAAPPAGSHHDMFIPLSAVRAGNTRYVRRLSHPSVASVSESPSARHGTTPSC